MSDDIKYRLTNTTTGETHEAPDITLINQILKYSETDKEEAIKQLTNLFARFRETNNITDPVMNADMCKELVEKYLKEPYLTDDAREW